MKIVADANIPFVQEAFQTLGTVTTINGREICPENVSDADILLVRSVTTVNQALLENSTVKYVGTATIGEDHVDTNYLKNHGIDYCCAPGSNAVSAAEYVISALLVLSKKHNIKLEDQTVGIVGCGNVGSRLFSRLQALNVQCLFYDPPRAERFDDREYVQWQEVIQANVVTAHVPLTFDGSYPTYRMFDESFFAQMKNNATFINTSRGRVVDESALMSVLANRGDLQLVLDVWEGEPNINLELLQQTAIATPHIAGYSLDGKVRGTEMVYHEICRYLNVEPRWTLPPLPFAESFTAMQFDDSSTDEDVIARCVTNAYDILEDDKRLRKVADLTAMDRADYFDSLRKYYPVRREFSNYEVIISQARSHLIQSLSGLGFKVEEASSTLTS